MSTTGVSTDISSRGYGDQIAAHYKVRESLTRDLERRLEDLGERRVRKLIRWVNGDDELEASGNSSSLKLLQEKENYRIYERIDEKEKLLVVKGVLLLQNSSCDEVMELLSGKTGSDVQDFLTDVFAAQYGDSTVLHFTDLGANFQQQSSVSSDKTSRSSSVSSVTLPSATTMLFQWLALKDMSVQLPLRDFLFMRFNQSFPADDPTSQSKVAYGASIWESFEIPSCRPIFGATQMVRHKLRNCGYVVESSDETDATRVTFFITAPLDQASNQSDRAWLMRMAGSVRLLPSALVNLRIRENRLIDKSQWDSRDKCALCTTSFNMLKRAHHCRICGTSVCSKCCSVRRDPRSKSSSGIRVCMSCLNGEDTSALWGASMTKKHLGNSSITSSGSSRSHHQQSKTNRDSNTSKDSWSSARDLERSTRTSYQSSSMDSSFSSTSRSFDDLSADADASAALSSLRSNLSRTIDEDPVDEDDVLANTSISYPLTYQKGNAWPDAPIPATEAARLQKIKSLNLSQTYAKFHLKELLDLARSSISCPVATVSVITAATSLLVTAVGLQGDQLPRDLALESHVIMSATPCVVLDTQKDEWCAHNPLVSQLHIRFYIGIPLVTKEGIVVGVLSLGDVATRDKVKGSDLRSLLRIAARIVDKMDSKNYIEPSSAMPSSSSSAKTTRTSASIGGMLLL
uniref:FYVE-type domain-containing protein n=1 Tax=Globisporangium ultimum (strain ATCC 200006 / CBS 805.95 / DAOM BR144) TaxID=431595 RepID=K3W7P6_GLOUD